MTVHVDTAVFTRAAQSNCCLHTIGCQPDACTLDIMLHTVTNASLTTTHSFTCTFSL